MNTIQFLKKIEELKKDFLVYIKQVNKALPLLAVFITFTTGINQWYYYNTFNIDIFKYLELSEFTLLFLHNIINFLALLFVYSIGCAGAFIIINIINHLKLLKGEPTIKLLLVILSCIMIPAFLLLKYSSAFPNFFSMMLAFIVLSFMITLVYQGFKKHLDLLIQYISKINLILTFFFIIYILSIFMFPAMEITPFKTKQYLYKHKLILKDRIIDYDSHEKFIGKTNKYIFLRNDSSGENIIISTDDVKEFKEIKVSNPKLF